MTSLAARFLGTADDPEDTPVTTPPRRIPAVPGANGIPWYAGVPGLDPECRVADWTYAARCAAMACAALVLGAEAGRHAALRTPRSAPAAKWLEWLFKASDEVDGKMRILALRLTCEHAGAISADQVLQAASDLHAACWTGW